MTTETVKVVSVCATTDCKRPHCARCGVAWDISEQAEVCFGRHDTHPAHSNWRPGWGTFAAGTLNNNEIWVEDFTWKHAGLPRSLACDVCGRWGSHREGCPAPNWEPDRDSRPFAFAQPRDE
jgi:hypothetical protein